MGLRISEENERTTLMELIDSVDEMALNKDHTVGLCNSEKLNDEIDDIESYTIWRTYDEYEVLNRNLRYISELMRLRWDMTIDDVLSTETINNLSDSNFLKGYIKIFLLGNKEAVLFKSERTKPIVALAPRLNYVEEHHFEEPLITKKEIDKVNASEYLSEEVKDELNSLRVKERLMKDNYYKRHNK